MRRQALGFAFTALAATGLLLLWVSPGAVEPAKKFKIFLSMSYTGNDWQSENANMLQAMAKTKTYRDKVDLQVQVAGANAQVQSQQINSMVQAGANAIVVFPISPTGINNAVKAACSKGVIVIAYAADIDEPCAYIVTIDEKQVGPITAQWLVDELHGKGRIVLVTGVAGTSVDADRTNGAKSIFAKYPDIKIIAEVNGNWSQPTARQELAKVVATHGWDGIDGLLLTCRLRFRPGAHGRRPGARGTTSDYAWTTLARVLSVTRLGTAIDLKAIERDRNMDGSRKGSP